MGVVLFAIGAVAIAMNIAFLLYAEQYYALLFVVGFSAVLLGLWAAITGRFNTPGVVHPLWWRIGMHTAIWGGALAGVAISVALQR
jgi:hypothetical protein